MDAFLCGIIRRESDGLLVAGGCTQAAMRVLLPPELIVHIFTLAASSSLKSARTLSAVCAWVRALVQPHLFSCIMLDGLAQALDFRDRYCAVYAHDLPGKGSVHARLRGLMVRRLQGCVRPEHSRRRQRQAFLERYGRPDEIAALWVAPARGDNMVYDALYNLQRMAHLALSAELCVFFLAVNRAALLFPGLLRTPLRVTVLDPPDRLLRNLKGIPATLGHIRAARISRPNHCRLTHLHFAHPLPWADNALLISMSHFGLWFLNLTHFAVPFAAPGVDLDGGPFDWCTTAVSQLPEKLRMFVVIFYNDGFLTSQRTLDWLRDTRLLCKRFYFARLDPGNVRRDWKDHIEDSGESVWEKAFAQTRKWESTECIS